MTPEEELALKIFEIHDSVRRSAVEAGEGDEVGGEVTADEILEGVIKAGLFETEQMVNDLAMGDESLLEEHSNAFCDWMNEYVYMPIAEMQLDLMIEEGILEVKSVDKDGEFTYGLTKKGIEENIKRKPK